MTHPGSRLNVMNLRYFRYNIFMYFLRPFSRRTRERRMRLLSATMGLRSGTTILDLGGQPMIWDSIPFPLDLTILNLPGVAISGHVSHHGIRYVEGDACRVEAFADRSFDIVFSNSVIEHVGPSNKQAEFAHEARRLGRSYWIQTPSKWFPIEAHCGMPFWWFYPAALRRDLIESWREKLPVWTEMVEETTVLTKADMRRLFPEAEIAVETSFGFPKSYVAHFLRVDSPAAAGDTSISRRQPQTSFEQASFEIV
jgi:hypothetical protein